MLSLHSISVFIIFIDETEGVIIGMLSVLSYCLIDTLSVVESFE